jgi:pyridoxamine 5'-phosphate oxidase
MELFNDLLPDPLPTEPMALVNAWLETARAARQQPNPESMILATATADGRPSARVVLCKSLDVEHGRVSFVTNYDSRKGRELAANPRAALVFHWDHTHRQVRIEGMVVKAPEAESDEYFASRNWQRRIGAWASAQSQPLRSREQLDAAVRAAARRFRQYRRVAGGGDPATALLGRLLRVGAIRRIVDRRRRTHPRAGPLDPVTNYSWERFPG